MSADDIDAEAELLNRLLTARADLGDVLKAGITADHFGDLTYRKAFADVCDYHEQYGAAPPPDWVFLRHAELGELPDSGHQTGYLVNQLARQRQRRTISVASRAAIGMLDQQGTDAARDVLRSTAKALKDGEGTSRDFGVTSRDDVEYWLKLYEQCAENHGKLLGFTTGFKGLDALTQGIQPHQFIVSCGFAKSFKTMTLLQTLRHAHAAGAKVMVLSFEMTHEQIGRRIHAAAAGVDPKKILTGRLRPEEKRRLDKAVRSFEGMHELVITEDRMSAMTVEGIADKIDELAPDICFIDGAYLLRDTITKESRTPIALSNICDGLKQLTLDACPIYATTQALEKGSKVLSMSSVGYSTAFAQNADLLIGSEKVPDSDDFFLKILAARNCGNAEFKISIDWDTYAINEEVTDGFDIDF